MIVHNVAFKLAEADKDLRAEQAAEFARRILAMEGKIPGLLGVSVGIDVGLIDGHYDLVLISKHETYADLEAYQADPLHGEVIAFGKTIVAERAAVDYEVA